MSSVTSFLSPVQPCCLLRPSHLLPQHAPRGGGRNTNTAISANISPPRCPFSSQITSPNNSLQILLHVTKPPHRTTSIRHEAVNPATQQGQGCTCLLLYHHRLHIEHDAEGAQRHCRSEKGMQHSLTSSITQLCSTKQTQINPRW